MTSTFPLRLSRPVLLAAAVGGLSGTLLWKNSNGSPRQRIAMARTDTRPAAHDRLAALDEAPVKRLSEDAEPSQSIPRIQTSTPEIPLKQESQVVLVVEPIDESPTPASTEGQSLPEPDPAAVEVAAPAIPRLSAASTWADPAEVRSVFPAGVPGGTLGRQILARPSYVLEYDPRTRQALWSCDVLERDTHAPRIANRANSNFHEEKSIDERFRARLSDYRGSGYDRGHLVPAGNAKTSQEAMNATFGLGNISPQVGAGFNRDYWARLEELVRRLSRTHWRVSVCTGPLWIPRRDSSGKYVINIEVIGEPPSVWVPTHFYKIVLCEPEPGETPRIVTFIIPNAFIPENTPLSSFVSTKEQLERAAGVSFFDSYFDQNQFAEQPTSLCGDDGQHCELPVPDFWKREKSS